MCRDGVRKCRAIRGEVNRAGPGAKDLNGGASNAADVLVSGGDKVGEHRGIVDDDAVGAGVEDKGATVGVADEALWDGGEGWFGNSRSSLSLGAEAEGSRR